MRFPRQSGILLHPTSLPGGHGIGDFGPEAFRFVEFLAEARQTLWQMLPLGPTGYGDSPYQTFSTFAGNPLLISLDTLADAGLLSATELAGARFGQGSADYASVIHFKLLLLDRAAKAFFRDASLAQRAAFDTFCAAHAAWLDDFALFMTAKRAHGMRAWTEWEPALRDRVPSALDTLRLTHSGEIEAEKFKQFVFFEQFNALRNACRHSGIRLMGDIPIYAAGDSSDVWSARRFWHLNADGTPALQSGVPPDYFSATGQLWGNPIYRWDEMERDGYRWWIQRIRAIFALFDVVRVDHFRGFQAFWEVSGGEITATNGRWTPGPGIQFFETIAAQLGELAIVAENLGVITPEVEAIRHRFGFPGMAILQFAFGRDPQAPDFKPHNYPRELVAYTGTHDNDTTVGWWTSSGEGDSTRTPEMIAEERDHTLRYLGLASGDEIHWSFIRALMASVANTVVFPAQDLLGLGSPARMNMPSTLGTNWLWRLEPSALTPAIAARLAEMVKLYDRLPAAE
ncbi:MAG: 4-alpha-glucanotransferase [Bryobacteraceae bacterium]